MFIVRWLICLLSLGIILSQDDGLPPNFVYLEPIEDYYARNPIEFEIIVTDRNEIDKVSIFYRFNDDIDFMHREMQVAGQPVIFDVEIPFDEVIPGFVQYYFWARDEFGNEATWPSGGEDLPIVLPIYAQQYAQKKEIKKTIPKETKEIPEIVKKTEYFLKELENNLPYYLEVGMLAPNDSVVYEEGVPIIVLSIYDPEQITNQATVKLLVDGKPVTSFNSEDMITYIPLEPFPPGYHIIRYETNNISGESLVKEFAFFMNEEITDESEIEKITWKDKIKFKGDLGWNTDYDPSPNNPIDVHKINSSVKFQLGNYKFNLSGLTSTHLYDSDAREEAKHRQPSTRLKFKMKSSYLDLNYGDSSPEFSEFSLKGTRIRGINAKIKWGSWETFFVSGETKHWIDNLLSDIKVWDSILQYKAGDQVYYRGAIWENVTSNSGKPDTLTGDWLIVTESEYSFAPNDACIAVEPAMYGLDPLNEGDTLAVWSGSECEQVILFSRINMMTGVNGIDEGYLFEDVAECLQRCKTPIINQKGSPIRQLQGIRTSKDFYEHAKFGISAIRSWDVRDTELVPYTILDEYSYEGNIVAAGDFLFHFNNDKTVLSGEYGISMTIDQSYSDTLLLKNMNNIDIDRSLYNSFEWNGVDYCFQNQCVDIDGNGTIDSVRFIEGVIKDSLLWSEITNSRKKLRDIGNTLGFSINDDINGYAEGRGFSGLTGPEIGHLINGGLDSIYLLFKKPAFKMIFKTPIPLSFTELNFQTELNQAPLNYLSHGSSSIQTDVRNWKNKLGFKLLKNQINFSFGYDKQIKSPWDPESESDGEIKRGITYTQSGSVGLSFRNYPGLNYSIRLQDREDKNVSFINGVLSDTTTGLKKMTTHTIAPTHKISFGKTNINLNGNINLVSDLDLFSDLEGCYEILNSTKGEEWGGDSTQCEGENEFYFNQANNPIRDSGNLTSTYTGAISFSFPSPLTLNLGWGMSINYPNDLRQKETVISVYSMKLGYKFFNNTLSVTLGGNYVIGFKGGNEFWDSGETFLIDSGTPDKFDQGDSFIDNIELDNNKLSLKGGLQYKMPQNMTLGINFDYNQAKDNLATVQEEPTYKAKIAIKYGF